MEAESKSRINRRPVGVITRHTLCQPDIHFNDINIVIMMCDNDDFDALWLMYDVCVFNQNNLAKQVSFLWSWTGVCDDRGVWVGVHHPDLVGRMLLSLQRMAGTTALCQEAFLRHRWVVEPLCRVSFVETDTDKFPTPSQKKQSPIPSRSTCCLPPVPPDVPAALLHCFTSQLPSSCPLVVCSCPLRESSLMSSVSTVPLHAIDHSLLVSFSVVVRAPKSREHLRNEVALTAFYSFHCLDMDLSALGKYSRVLEGEQGSDVMQGAVSSRRNTLWWVLKFASSEGIWAKQKGEKYSQRKREREREREREKTGRRSVTESAKKWERWRDEERKWGPEQWRARWRWRTIISPIRCLKLWQIHQLMKTGCLCHLPPCSFLPHREKPCDCAACFHCSSRTVWCNQIHHVRQKGIMGV